LEEFTHRRSFAVDDFAYDRSTLNAKTSMNIAGVATARPVLPHGDDGSLGGVVMAEIGVSERVERIESKLDVLSESVDQRFKEVDKQFLEVREHFVEQRKYVEFAYDKLDNRMAAGFSRLDQRVDDLDNRMAAGFSRLDQRVDDLDKRFSRLDQRVDDLDKRMTEGFSRLERKLDQVIDSRSRSTSATPRRARPSKRRR
jgi:chromosome segregation ATPase